MKRWRSYQPDRSGIKLVLWLFAVSFACFALAALTGCAIPKPLRGGVAKISPTTAGSAVEISQPENPATPSTQEHQVNDETTFTVPAGSVITQRAAEVVAPGRTNVTELAVAVSEPTPVRRLRTEATKQQVGAAQKDTARELGAKLAALRPVQYVGLVLILAAVAMFHPVVKALIGSRTVQLVTAGTGLALIVLPTVLVGNERLILLAALIPAVWWIIHRNASKSTEVRVLREWLDADGDGKDDVTGLTMAQTQGTPKQ